MIVKSVTEMAALATRLLAGWAASPDKALVVGLYGNLGSGKTTFVQSLARALGVNDSVTSPTFVIEKIYPLKNQERGFSTLVHLDCYRLSSPEELLALGWAELVAKPKSLVVVEWAERIESILPPGQLKLQFTFIDENTREVIWP